MKTLLKAVALALAMSTAAFAQTSRPAEPWPGPKGEHFFIEAEHFQKIGKGWSVTESTDGWKGSLYASNEKCLNGSPAGDEEASHTINIPEAGEWFVWVRYARISRAAGRGADTRNEPMPMDLIVRQNAREVAKATIADERAVGRGDYAWKMFPAKLEAGQIELAAHKSTNKKVPEHVRRIDCVVVTKDAAYKADYRDFVPQMYLRFTLEEADQPKARLAHRVTSDRIRRGPISDFAQVGQAAPWVNITRHYDGHEDIRYNVIVDSKVTQCKYTLEFATAPSDAAVVKKIRYEGGDGSMQMLAPPSYANGHVPMADHEYAAARADWVSKFPVFDFGRRPTVFPCIIDTDLERKSSSPAAIENEWKVIEYVGLNGKGGILSPEDLKHGFTTCRLYNSAYYGEVGNGVLVPDLEKIRKDMNLHMSMIKDSPELHRAVHVKLIDEAQAPDLTWLVKHPLAQTQFKQWIKDRNIPVFTPEELADFKAKGVDPESQIALTEDVKTPHPGLYYWGQKFRAWTTINYFVQATKIAKEIYPPHIGTTQNFSDALVGGNIYSQGNDYWMYYRDEKALDVLQTEDWCNGASSRQSAGWNAIIARSATKYHGQPIHMYVIAASGRRPLEAKLKAFSTIAQGNKFLNYYTYNPKYKAEEVGWSERPDMIVGLAELSREIGAAEHVLMDAMPRTAETAIIYSVPTDIWTLGLSASQVTERLYTFYALRHAQVPVDVLCDDDITAGYLKHYKVAYLFGEQITAKNLQPLADWVKSGGTLVLSPAAGTRDEYNRVNNTLDNAFGFQRGETSLKAPITAGGIFLHRRNTTDETAVKVRVGENVFPAWGETQVVPKVDGMTVEATFEDGSPAAATYAVGQGKVVLRGFMPAVTYVDVAYKQLMETADKPTAPPMNVAKAMVASDPKQPRDWKDVRITQGANRGALPYAFDLRLLPLMTGPAITNIDKPVAVDAPIVEATFMEGKAGWVVPLANYSGNYIDKLTVTIKPGKAHGMIRSAHHGELKTEKQSDGSIKLSIPLESTDFVYAEWAK